MTRKKKYDPIYPYPLIGVWTTPSDVPVGVRILAENGGVYLKTTDGFEPLDAYLSFNGEIVLDEFGNKIQVDFGSEILVNENSEILLSESGTICQSL